MTSQVQQSENRHDAAGSRKETRTAGFGQTVLEPFLVFLRLGLTSFGGPIAHLGYFRQEFVERRKWLFEQNFADLVALCNFLPGPTSSQVCYSIGMTRGGIPGAISAWSAFTIPSATIMLLAAYGIHWLSGEQGASWLHGLKVVAVAVVAQAVWSMATRLCTDRTRISFAFVAAVIILLTNNSWVQVLAIALGALAGWKLIRAEAPPERSEMFTRLPSRIQSIGSMAIFAVCLLFVPLFAAGKRDGWLPLFDSFYRTGSLVFGGGHVVLPLLQAEVVPRGWLDNSTFLAGYGIAQALPGPVFSFAAYLGAAKSGSPNGWLAGLWCLFAILSPPVLLVTGLLPLWNRLRGFRRGSVVAGWGQCDSRWNSVGSALSAYLDKCNRFSEELGSRPHPVCRFADLEDSAVDPRPDRRGNRWNLFVRTGAKPKRSKSLLLGARGQTPRRERELHRQTCGEPPEVDWSRR
jgi:chromate transporter